MGPYIRQRMCTALFSLISMYWGASSPKRLCCESYEWVFGRLRHCRGRLVFVFVSSGTNSVPASEGVSMWKGRTAGRHLRRHSRRNGRHVRHMFSQECASQSSYSVDRPKPVYLAFTVPPGYSRSGCSIPRKRAESGSSQAEAFCSGQSLPYRGQGFRLIPSADRSSYEWGAKSRSTVHQISVHRPH